MSLVTLIRQQLGLSATPANNFTLDASADNGTMKLARGNAGATTQDIMTVDAAGKVDLIQLVRSLGATGSYELPGGLIIKWGITASISDTSSATVTFTTAFPDACFAAYTTNNGSGNIGYAGITAKSVTGLTVYRYNGNANAAPAFWFAIGN